MYTPRLLNNKWVSLCFILAVSYSYVGISQNTTGINKGYSHENWVVKEPFQHNVFIENKGQLPEIGSIQTIQYYSEKGKIRLYFTANSVIFSYDSISHPVTDKDEVEERRTVTTPVSFRMNWKGAYSSAHIEVEYPESNYFTYPGASDKSEQSSIVAHAWGKLIYRNIYKGIDIAFYYPDKGGMKYDIIVHPGANLSNINMEYSGASLRLLENNLIILSPFSTFIDHAPITADENGNNVSSSFYINNNTVSFKTGAYDKSKSLTIDPWVTSTTFTGINKAYNIDYDKNGNVYVYGGGPSAQYQLQKYDNTGKLKWTYTTLPFKFSDGTIGYRSYGDFTVDHRNGTSYIAEGFDDSLGCQIAKVNTNGVQSAIFGGNLTINEMWRVEFDYANSQLIIGAGGTKHAYQMCRIDTAFKTLTPINALNAPTGDNYHDVSLLALDEAGSAYMAVAKRYSSTSSSNYDNVLLQLPLPTLTPTKYQVSDGYSFLEVSSISYYPALPSAAGFAGNGFNGMAANSTMVLTYDGSVLKKWTCNGVFKKSAVVSVNSYKWGGIGLNECDSIYIGNCKSVNVYDSNLTLKHIISLSDTVYDLSTAPGNFLYACGKGYVASITINSNPINASIAVSPASGCGGGCNGAATASINGCNAGNSSNYTYKWSNGQTTQTATNLCPGKYIVSMSYGSQKYTDSVTIPSFSSGGISISVSKKNSCNSLKNGTASVNITSGIGPFTYNWTPTGDTTANVNNLAPGNYVVTVQNASGCVSDTVTITQPATVGSTMTITPPSCGSSNGTIKVTPIGGPPPYTYVWSPNISTTNTAAGVSAGVYSITLTDSIGCSWVVSTIVNNPTAPSLIIATTNLKCYGGSTASLSVTATGGKSPYTYLWSNGQTTSTASGLSAGSYTVAVTDANGCKSFSPAQLFNPIKLKDSITSSVNVTCNGGTNGTANSAISGGVAPYKYSWSPSGGTEGLASGLKAGTYTLTVTDTNGCTTSASVKINQPLPVTISATIVSASCGKNNGSIIATPSGGTPGYTYSWAPVAGTTNSIKNLSIGIYTVTVIDTLGCGPYKDTLTLSDSTAPVLKSITVNIKCNGGIGSDTIIASGGKAPYTYSWATSGGTKSIASGLSAGSYTVTVTDFNGCKSVKLVILKQPPALSGSISSTGITCNGGKNGTATITASGGTLPYSYKWSPSGGTGVTASALSAGTYSCTVTDKNGCTHISAITLTQPLAIRDSITSQTNELCNGNCIGKVIVGVKYGTTPYTYTWSSGSTKANRDSNLCVGNCTVTITDFNGCKSSPFVANITQPNPLKGNSTSTNASCGMNNGDISTSPSGGSPGYTYKWSPGGQTTQSIVGIGAGTYSITIKDSHGCSTSLTIPITTTAGVAISVCCDSTIQNGQVVQLNVNPSSSGYSFVWTPSTGLSCVNCPNPLANPNVTTTYYVTVTNTADGCSNIDSVLIDINPNSLHIYTGLTPNGDGIDDYWKIGGIEFSPDNSVSIYNRWGIEVWKGNGYNNTTIAWTGTDMQGEKLPDATYFYVLTVKGVIYKGWIQLMR